MPRFAPSDLTRYAAAVFVAAGAFDQDAELVAGTLVDANLAGHDSHGVLRVVQYLAGIERGDYVLQARPRVEGDGAVARVDGMRTFGQVGAQLAIRTAIERAQELHLAAVALHNANHVGRLSDWVEQAAARNLIGLGFCSTMGANPRVAAFGGSEGVLGTNPFAAAVPVADGEPIVVDFATSIVAEGKLKVAHNAGKPIPPGWLLDPQGRPTTDPGQHYAGGPILPLGGLELGGHKGYGLALLMDIFGSVLAGDYQPTSAGVSGNGVIFIVLDIAAFRPVGDFLTGVAARRDYVKGSRPLPGADEVLVPGEPERRTRAERTSTGIELDATSWRELAAAGERYGVEPPAPLA